MYRIFESSKAKRKLNFSKIRRQYNPKNLQLAFAATQTGTSVYRAARQYGIPESTLRDRTRGNVAVDARPGGETLLSHDEEKQLVDHVKYMSSIGYGYTKLNLQYLAADFASSQGKKTSGEKPLSDNWFYGFLGRWPDLKLAKPQKLSMLRAQYASKEVLSAYFQELATLMTSHGLHDKPERIFNLDETGVTTEHVPPKILCDITSQPQAVTSPRSSTVTIIGGGNAVGNYIPPYYVFPGKRWNDDFLDGAAVGSSGSMSKSGWSNTDIFKDYLTKHFIKHAGLSEGSSDKTLILFDGHRSHVSLTLVEWAKKYNVILFVLPPHTSHITQPLDVAVFGPFKSMYNRECQLFLQRNPGMKITKYEVAKLTAKPYLKALSPDNLTSAFRKAGIFPLCNSAYSETLVSPASIYPPVDENVESDVPSSPRPLPTPAGCPPSSTSQQTTASFFEQRKITSVTTVKPKKKRFVPPYLAGNLLKEKNVKIMESSKKNTEKKQQPSPVKKVKRSKSIPTTTTSSPQPGPSAFYVDDSDSSNFSELSDDSENCCVCGKNTPPAMRSLPYLVIVKWAQCDKCKHWTHLSFCTEITCVRRHGEFLCPHCA